MTINYFNSKYAKEIHDLVIKTSGGLNGIKDPGRLDSVLTFIQNDVYYETFEKKLARLVYSIVKFHIFFDGNKRSSIVFGTFFMKINGYEHCTGTFITQMENIVLWVAQGLIDEEFLIEIVTSIIENNRLTESIKIKLIHLL